MAKNEQQQTSNLGDEKNFVADAATNSKDVNARNVFKDPIMCCQFLREYSGIELFKDLTPDKIHDETDKYLGYLGIEFSADTVKKVIIDNCENVPIFLISLIEHKSRVDYNISIQLLKYMVCIWIEYGKEMKKSKQDNPENKSFMYPPIIPIVYYEGKEKWTAGLNLRDRINMSNIFSEYIPDFTYKLICNYDYTNEELLSHEDEMSLFMMINKLQTPEALHEFFRLDSEKLNAILIKAPEQTMNIIVSAMWAFMMKNNVPVAEASDYVGKVRDGNMGYLFENMEKMDIQAERRNTAEARQRADEAERKADEAEQRVDELLKEIEALKKQLAGQEG